MIEVGVGEAATGSTDSDFHPESWIARFPHVVRGRFHTPDVYSREDLSVRTAKGLGNAGAIHVAPHPDVRRELSRWKPEVDRNDEYRHEGSEDPKRERSESAPESMPPPRTVPPRW